MRPTTKGIAAAVLICLPATTRDIRQAFADATGPHVAAPTTFDDAACDDHLIANATAVLEQTGLIPRPSTLIDGYAHAASLPLQFTQFDAHRQILGRRATVTHALWKRTVAGTRPARLLHEFLTGANTDYIDDTLAAYAAFKAQPRVRALHDAGVDDQFELGPGLQAHQQGLPTYRQAVADTTCYGQALITTEGTLHLPTARPAAMGDYRLHELTHYACRVRAYLHTRARSTGLLAAHLSLRPDAGSSPLHLM